MPLTEISASFNEFLLH